MQKAHPHIRERSRQTLWLAASSVRRKLMVRAASEVTACSFHGLFPSASLHRLIRVRLGLGVV